jgi:hypothetical protein
MSEQTPRDDKLIRVARGERFDRVYGAGRAGELRLMNDLRASIDRIERLERALEERDRLLNFAIEAINSGRSEPLYAARDNILAALKGQEG